MSKLRDAMKDSIRKQVDGLLPKQFNSNATGTVQAINGDGTAQVQTDDGNTYQVNPILPIYLGQNVMVINIHDDKLIPHCIPLVPKRAPNLPIIPPFYTGKRLRLMCDATPTSGDGPIQFSFQDQYSSTLFKYVTEIVNGGIYLPSIGCTNYAVSPRGEYFGFLGTYNQGVNSWNVARCYNIGPKLTAGDVINATENIYQLATPELLVNWVGDPNSLSGQEGIPNPIDVSIDDNANTFILEYLTSGTTYGPKYPLPAYGDGPAVIAETFGGFAEGAGQPFWNNSLAYYTSPGGPSSTYHLFCLTPITFTNVPAWISIVPSSGTVNIPGYGTFNYNYTLTINPGVLGVGLYAATITTFSPTFPNDGGFGTLSIWLCINTSGTTFQIQEVTTDNSTLIATASFAADYTDGRILDAANAIVALNNLSTHTIDVVDLKTTGILYSTPTFTNLAFDRGLILGTIHGQTIDAVYVTYTVSGFFAIAVVWNRGTQSATSFGISNSSTDVGSFEFSVGLTFDSETSGYAVTTTNGFNGYVRKFTQSGALITIEPTPDGDVLNISPGPPTQLAPAEWREYALAEFVFGAVFTIVG